MIKPVLHRILIKPEDVETVSPGGIVLAINEAREQAAAEKGTVLDIGTTAFKDYGETPDLIKVGDKVFFAKYAGKQVTDVDGKKFLLVNDEDIVGVLYE